MRVFTKSIRLIFIKLTFLHITIRMMEGPLTLCHAISPRPFIFCSIWPYLSASPMLDIDLLLKILVKYLHHLTRVDRSIINRLLLPILKSDVVNSLNFWLLDILW